jgi:hypothetical protein
MTGSETMYVKLTFHLQTLPVLRLFEKRVREYFILRREGQESGKHYNPKISHS